MQRYLIGIWSLDITWTLEIGHSDTLFGYNPNIFLQPNKMTMLLQIVKYLASNDHFKNKKIIIIDPGFSDNPDRSWCKYYPGTLHIHRSAGIYAFFDFYI